MKEDKMVVHNPDVSLTLQKVSEGLFKSGLFPNAKNVYGAFAIVEYGHELGIPPMMALKNINIIKGQLAANGQLMLSLAIRQGVTYKVIEENERGATVEFRRGGMVYTSSFNEDDAKAAGLLGKDNWKMYPRDMYFWRAVVKGIRRIAPDAVMGLYTKDEITNGDIIDVAPRQVGENDGGNDTGWNLPETEGEDDVPDALGEQDLEDLPVYNPEQELPIRKPERKDAIPSQIKDPDAPLTEPQRKAIHAMLNKLGITDEMAKHEKVSDILGMDETLTSFSVLTKGEASKIIKTLGEEGLTQ